MRNYLGKGEADNMADKSVDPMGLIPAMPSTSQQIHGVFGPNCNNRAIKGVRISGRLQVSKLVKRLGSYLVVLERAPREL